MNEAKRQKKNTKRKIQEVHNGQDPEIINMKIRQNVNTSRPRGPKGQENPTRRPARLVHRACNNKLATSLSEFAWMRLAIRRHRAHNFPLDTLNNLELSIFVNICKSRI